MMRILRDPDCLLAEGLATLRTQFQVPASFPAPVLAAAGAAAQRAPTDHVDWTERPFVTLDPADSTDLDQAFAIEAAGADWLLHYAIADVGWFVAPGDALDAEAWVRGVTTYLPGGKAGLYPPVLAEGAASLLPDGPRPAVVFTVRVDPDGETVLDGVTRAVIRSRAKLAYETVRDLGMQSSVVFGVRSPGQAQALHMKAPDAVILGFLNSPADIPAFYAAGGGIARLWEDEATAASVAAARGGNHPVWITAGQRKAGTAGEIDEARLRRLIDLEIDGVLVNAPGRALALRQEEAAS